MEYTSKWSKEIADSVRDKLKELQIPRYKYMVQVVVGERKSQGVRMGCRCLWDSETDNFATAEFSNVRVSNLLMNIFSFSYTKTNEQQETIFCTCTAFGVYLY